MYITKCKCRHVYNKSIPYCSGNLELQISITISLGIYSTKILYPLQYYYNVLNIQIFTFKKQVQGELSKYGMVPLKRSQFPPQGSQ